MILQSTSEHLAPKRLKNKFLGVSVAFFIATVTVASALTPAEKLIQSQLVPAGSIGSATALQIDNATKLAILSTLPANINIATLVRTGAYYAPSYAPDFVYTGLTQLQTLGLTSADVASQTAEIVKTAMIRTLTGSPKNHNVGASNPADGASAVTANAIAGIGGDTADSNLINIVVSVAIRNAQNKGLGDQNGAAGTVTGAISQIAGIGNENVADTTLTTNDDLVISVIKTAVSSARYRTIDISKAIGYSFAATYLASSNDNNLSTVDFQTFLDDNLDALAAAIDAGLVKGQGHVRARHLTNYFDKFIVNQITAGISLAFNGATGPGASGVSNFAFNNGVGDPTTSFQ